MVIGKYKAASRFKFAAHNTVSTVRDYNSSAEMVTPVEIFYLRIF